MTTTPDAAPSWFTRRRLIGGGVVLALLVGGWLYASSRGPAKTDGKDANVPPLVTVITPKQGSVMSSVSLTGQISAQNDMPIGVEGEGGRIAAVLVEPGDRVHRGQVLARLNPLTAQSQVTGAEASLDELRADAATAQAEYARAEGARDSFSVEEFERRRTGALTAQPKVKLAEKWGSLELLGEHLKLWTRKEGYRKAAGQRER